MNIQQVCALIIVAVCSVYLARQAYISIKAFFNNKSEGCGSGCGKCAFAQQRDVKPARTASIDSVKLIPLASVRRRPPSSRESASK